MPRKKTIKIPEPVQLPSGSWHIHLRVGGKSKYITEPDEMTCRAKALAYKTGILEEKKRPEKITLGVAIDRYIDARSPTLSPSTVRGYEIARRNRFRSLMDEPLDRLTKQSVQRAISDEVRAGKSAKTIRNSWMFVASVLREHDIHFDVSLPQVIPNERPFLRVDQIPTFLALVKDTDLEIPCYLGLLSCRRSEIAGLRWVDVDFGQRVIRIRNTVVPGPDHTLVAKKTTKNASSARVIPIPDRLYSLLKAAKKVGTYVCDIDPDTLRNRINVLCRENDLPQIGVHGLRHSFASLGHHLGIPERDLMEMGGWSDLGTMSKIYTHIAREDIQRQNNKMLSFLDGKTENREHNEQKSG